MEKFKDALLETLINVSEVMIKKMGGEEMQEIIDKISAAYPDPEAKLAAYGIFVSFMKNDDDEMAAMFLKLTDCVKKQTNKMQTTIDSLQRAIVEGTHEA